MELRLQDTVLLAGHTARSSVYSQVLVERGLRPGRAILYGNPGNKRPGQGGPETSTPRSSQGVITPDASIPVAHVLHSAEWPVHQLDAESVNDPEAINALASHSPKLVIFSGYGGEIVRPRALQVAPFLHVHSGWLPDYKGSTTGYYSWIERGDLGASAILLDARIDTGPVLARHRFPLPERGVDVDYVWDPAIRAHVLAEVLQHVAEHGRLPPAQRQEDHEGRTFYVVHPVLKHLAILKG